MTKTKRLEKWIQQLMSGTAADHQGATRCDITWFVSHAHFRAFWIVVLFVTCRSSSVCSSAPPLPPAESAWHSTTSWGPEEAGKTWTGDGCSSCTCTRARTHTNNDSNQKEKPSPSCSNFLLIFQFVFPWIQSFFVFPWRSNFKLTKFTLQKIHITWFYEKCGISLIKIRIL